MTASFTERRIHLSNELNYTATRLQTVAGLLALGETGEASELLEDVLAELEQQSELMRSL